MWLQDDMEFAILDAFIQKRVSQRFTNIGRDVICRMGSEISVHTYAKVAVLQAYRVVVMLHERDVRLAQLNPGMFNVHDAYTLQVRSLRELLFLELWFCVGTLAWWRVSLKLHRYFDAY